MLIPSTERTQFLRFQLSTAALVLGYGILHDQWLVILSPDHFTVYHPDLIPTESPTLQALQLSVVATCGPGLALGAVFWVICRAGLRHPRLPFTAVWPRLLILLAINELGIASIALFSAWRFRTCGEAGLLLPRWVYPEIREDLIIAQNVQLAAYVAGALGAFVLSAILVRKRFHARKPPGEPHSV